MSRRLSLPPGVHAYLHLCDLCISRFAGNSEPRNMTSQREHQTAGGTQAMWKHHGLPFLSTRKVLVFTICPRPSHQDVGFQVHGAPHPLPTTPAAPPATMCVLLKQCLLPIRDTGVQTCKPNENNCGELGLMLLVTPRNAATVCWPAQTHRCLLRSACTRKCLQCSGRPSPERRLNGRQPAELGICGGRRGRHRRDCPHCCIQAAASRPGPVAWNRYLWVCVQVCRLSPECFGYRPGVFN